MLSEERKEGIMNRSEVGWKHRVTALTTYICEQQAFNIYARMQNGGRYLISEGGRHANTSAHIENE